MIYLTGASWRNSSWRRRRLITRNAARLWYQAATYVVASWMPRAGSRFRGSGPPHLVLLARHLPPTVNGGVYRPVALLEEAARRRWEVTAVCGEAQHWHPEAGQELARRIPATCRIIRWEDVGIDANPLHTPEVDGGFDAVVPILAAARNALGQRRPSLVLATGPTFVEFIAAMVLGASYRVPYVLDYRDEWSECPFDFVLKGRSNRFWESRTLSRAALVTFTTEAQRQHQIERFPVLARARSAVLPNGWDNLASASDHAPAPVENTGVPTIAFLGNLSSYTSLPTFLAALRDAVGMRPDLAGRIRLVFVGMKDPELRDALTAFPVSGLLESRDQVPLSEAQGIMRRSDALLLLNPRDFSRYIAGKTFEYAASGRPILVYGEAGETARLLSGYPAATIVRGGDGAGLATALDRVARRAPVPAVDPDFIKGMSRTERSRAHVDLLEAVIAGASRGSEAANPRPS